MDGAQAFAVAQRVRRIAMVVGAHMDRARIPGEHFVPQAHRALVRDQAEDSGAVDHAVVDHAVLDHACVAVGSRAAPLPGSPVSSRAISNASAKLPNTPIATVLPIARSTGIDDKASRLNTSNVVRLHTITACRVRSCSARSSPACSKNNA